jgi:hypothetical protein
MDLLTFEARCSGCGRALGENDGAFVMRGKQLPGRDNSRATFVCYACSLKSEEIFLYTRLQEKTSVSTKLAGGNLGLQQISRPKDFP